MLDLFSPLRNQYMSLAAALLAGLMLPLAYAPFDLYPVIFIAIALLFAVWWVATPKQAFVSSWFFGLGMFGFGAHWVYVSMYEFGGVPFALSIALTVLFVCFLALFPAVLAYGVTKWCLPICREHRAWAFVIVLPAAWLLGEWVRGWFLTGFPWLLAGYSQLDTVLVYWAPVLGVYGVSWLVAICAGAFLFALTSRSSMRWRVLAIPIAIFVLGWAGKHISWSQPLGEPIKVSMIQGNIAQDVKWLPEMRRPTIELYLASTREHWDSDLIIWPESALPDFYDHVEFFLQALGEEARENNTDMLIGILSQEWPSGRYFNSMLSLGTEQGFYHKSHLVPFTEYLPLKSVLGPVVDFMNVPMSDFTKGEADQKTLQVAGHTVGLSICYEDAFGEEMLPALPAASFFVNASNDAWFGTSIAPHQHLQIARMRAVEFARPLLRSTNTGVTAVIDHWGKTVSALPQFKMAVLTETVQPMTGATLYARVGNVLVLLLAALSVICAFVYLRRSIRP